MSCRPLQVVFGCLLSLAAQGAFAQVVVPATIPAGRLIYLDAEPPASGKVVSQRWYVSPSVDVGEGDLTAARPVVTAPVGRHEVQLVRVVEDGESLLPELWESSFTVGPAEPTPAPDQRLATLVDAATAERLAASYRALAAIVRTGGDKTVGDFRARHAAGMRALGLAGHGAESTVERRLAAVLGDDDAPLDADKLGGELLALAAEFSGSAPTPVNTVQPDPSLAVVLPGAAPGVRATIIEETDRRDDLPAGQLDQITSSAPGSVRATLRAVAAKLPDGTPEVFVLDDDLPGTGLPAYWRRAWESRPRDPASLPWLILANGERGYAGPLPATRQETLAILARVQTPVAAGGRQ